MLSEKELRHIVSQKRKKVNRYLRQFEKQRDKTSEYLMLKEYLKESGFGQYNRKKRSYEFKTVRGWTKNQLLKMNYEMDKLLVSPSPKEVRWDSKKYKNYNDRNYIAERIRDRTGDPYRVLYFIEMTDTGMSIDELMKNELKTLRAKDSDIADVLGSKQLNVYNKMWTGDDF